MIITNENIYISNTIKCLQANENLFNYLKKKYPNMNISLKDYKGYYNEMGCISKKYNYIELTFKSRTYIVEFSAYNDVLNKDGSFFIIKDRLGLNVNKTPIYMHELDNLLKFTNIIFKVIDPKEEYKKLSLF